MIINLKKEEGLIVKIADSNMEARTIAVIDALLQIKWLDIQSINSNQIKQIYMKEIISQDNEVLGSISSSFRL